MSSAPSDLAQAREDAWYESHRQCAAPDCETWTDEPVQCAVCSESFCPEHVARCRECKDRVCEACAVDGVCVACVEAMDEEESVMTPAEALREAAREIEHDCEFNVARTLRLSAAEQAENDRRINQYRELHDRADALERGERVTND